MIVTIDGPAGSGKSTVARLLASRLDMRYLDTGALYRAVTWLALERGLDIADDNVLTALARANEPVFAEGSSSESGGEQATEVLIAGRDVTREIRTERVSRAVTQVARLPGVRKALSALQRRLAEGRDYIAEGRDMGTVVFPDAALKLYLDADPAERARRRHRELAQRGESVPIEKLASDLRARDDSDSRREHAPLARAEDAEVIDTTSKSIEQVVDELAARVEAVRARP